MDKFKIGDKVMLRGCPTSVGVITRKHEENPSTWWVFWEDDHDEYWASEEYICHFVSEKILDHTNKKYLKKVAKMFGYSIKLKKIKQ